MKLIEDVGFDQSFSFIYSRRPGTPAADLSKTTRTDADKHARLQRLQAAINANATRDLAGDGRQRADACWSRRPRRRTRTS